MTICENEFSLNFLSKLKAGSLFFLLWHDENWTTTANTALVEKEKELKIFFPEIKKIGIFRYDGFKKTRAATNVPFYAPFSFRAKDNFLLLLKDAKKDESLMFLSTTNGMSAIVQMCFWPEELHVPRSATAKLICFLLC